MDDEEGARLTCRAGICLRGPRSIVLLDEDFHSENERASENCGWNFDFLPAGWVGGECVVVVQGKMVVLCAEEQCRPSGKITGTWIGSFWTRAGTNYRFGRILEDFVFDMGLCGLQSPCFPGVLLTRLFYSRTARWCCSSSPHSRRSRIDLVSF